MRRPTVLRCIALLFSLTLAACAAYQAQHSGRSGGGSAGYEAPSAAPSADFTELPVGSQTARVRGEVEEVKARLAAEGKYACCVRPACSECLLRYGECHCQESAAHAGPCCGECTEAWLEGRGAVEGVTAWELLERKKKAIQEGKQKPGAPVWEETGQKPPEEHQHHQHHHH